MLIPDRRFRPEPMTAVEAIAWLQAHRYIWVQAPFDHSPVKCYCNSKLKLWKRDATRFSVTVQSHHCATEVHTIDNGVLDRLRMPFSEWHHGISATLTHVDYIGKPRTLVLHQSNGFHLEMHSVRHAIAFAKRQAMELTVSKWFHGKLKTRTLVKACRPISGEHTF